MLGGLYVLPKEGADKNVIDVTASGHRHGPYYMTENSEVSYRWKKNPNFKPARN